MKMSMSVSKVHIIVFKVTFKKENQFLSFFFFLTKIKFHSPFISLALIWLNPWEKYLYISHTNLASS